MMKSICVFCGSSSGRDPIYREAARALAAAMVPAGIRLVYGGARVGLMGLLADAILDLGGEVVGVIPASLFPKEIPHQNLTQLHVVDSMHQRKHLMYELSDGFIALPGGLGTLDELFEILTWGQLGLHAKPCGLLNVAGYYEKILEFMERAEIEQFLRPEHRRLLLHDETSEGLLEKMKSHQETPLKKWIQDRET